MQITAKQQTEIQELKRRIAMTRSAKEKKRLEGLIAKVYQEAK